jgi:hypothetical protein
MRNKEGEGTHWTEGYAGRVIEWALSLKPEKALHQGTAALPQHRAVTPASPVTLQIQKPG